MANAITRINVSSISDLIKKSHVELKGRKPEDVFERLKPMLDKGESALRNGQEEVAYIYFKRWQTSVEFIKNNEKKERKFYSLLTSEEEVIIS